MSGSATTHTTEVVCMIWLVHLMFSKVLRSYMKYSRKSHVTFESVFGN